MSVAGGGRSESIVDAQRKAKIEQNRTSALAQLKTTRVIGDRQNKAFYLGNGAQVVITKYLGRAFSKPDKKEGRYDVRVLDDKTGRSISNPKEFSWNENYGQAITHKEAFRRAKSAAESFINRYVDRKNIEDDLH